MRPWPNGRSVQLAPQTTWPDFSCRHAHAGQDHRDTPTALWTSTILSIPRTGKRIMTRRRAAIRGLPGPLSPGMAYWMVACTVYLFIVTLGVNVRFCRVQVVFDGLVSTG